MSGRSDVRAGPRQWSLAVNMTVDEIESWLTTLHFHTSRWRYSWMNWGHDPPKVDER